MLRKSKRLLSGCRLSVSGFSARAEIDIRDAIAKVNGAIDIIQPGRCADNTAPAARSATLSIPVVDDIDDSSEEERAGAIEQADQEVEMSVSVDECPQSPLIEASGDEEADSGSVPQIIEEVD